MELSLFAEQYISSALADVHNSEEWTRDTPPTLDDLSDLTKARMLNDCASFRYAAASLFEGRESDAGHDFWMTRNGHGAGFWDGDWSDPAATILDVASRACGEFALYVGDDGRIHN
ncbi:hypothetical protein J7I97_16905 [Streptomyces sp. ISL-87]|uniref:hypothetical protein n=1 Tax=Streptomyces sp. ISL-87 TaxID=2819188 RepID=UPI001BEB887C|nr:hypothetical protein [Streptomyces sp. ISL-87]MBT2609907.1 hypothetical protein [Streptomyces sp. ISL-87]